MSVLSQIKSAFRKVFGGGSKSSSKPRQSYSRQSTTRASRVSNYGGGGSRSYRDYSSGSYRADYQDRQAAEQRRRQEQEQKRQATTNALASISKRTDALSSGRSSSVASSATSTGNGYKVAIKKIEQKAKNAPPDPKVKALADSNERVTNALKVKAPETMVKSGDYEYRPKANNSNAPSAGNKSTTRLTLQGYKKRMDNDVYRVAESYARGFGSDATYGVLDTLMRGNKDDKTEQDIEKYYQEHKSARAEGLGRLTGALLSFGMTGDAATSLASEIAPNFIKKGGRYAAEYLAKNPTFRKLAAKEAKKAGMELTEDVIERFAKQRAARVINAVGKDMAINWTTGGAMDVNYALRDTYDENEGNFDIGDFGKNLAKNRAINYGVGGLVTVAPALRTQKGLLKDGLFGTDFLKKGARDDALNLAKTIADERAARPAMMDTFGRNADNVRFDMNDLLKKNLKESTDALSTPKIGEQAKAELPKMRQAMREAFVKEGDDAARRVDMNEILEHNSPFGPAGEAVDADYHFRVNMESNEPYATATKARDTLEALSAKIQRGESLTDVEREHLEAYDHLIAFNELNFDQMAINERTLRISSEAEALSRRSHIPYADAVDRILVARHIEAARAAASQESDDVLLHSLENYNRQRSEALEAARNVEPPKAEPPRVEAPEAPRAEPPTANAEAPTAEPPRKVTVEDVKKAQTKEESQKLMQAYFDENGEADLGIYGQITKNADGTYKIVVNGADGEVTLTKAEAEKRIKDSINKAYAEPRKVKSIKDVVHTEKERVDFRTRLKKATATFHRQLVDSLKPFEDLERQIAKAEGRNPNYGAINKARVYQGPANRSIGNRQLDRLGNQYKGTVKRIGADGVEYEIDNGKSIVDIYKFFDGDKELEGDFDLYLNCRHAPDRILQGKEVFENIIDDSGRNFSDATVCREEADRLLKEHPEFAKKAEEVYQYIQNELKNRVDAGLLKQDVVDEWNKMYPHYVPTYRDGFFNEVHGLGPEVGAEDLKGATGSSRNIMSIRDQLAASTTRNWRDISLNDLLKHSFGDKIASELAQEADGGLGTVLENSISLEQKNNGRYYATIFDEDGTKHTVEIGEEYYEGLRDLYKNGRLGVGVADTINDGFAKYNNAFKKLITQWSPIFMVKNPMRDIPEAFLNTKQTKEFLQCMIPAVDDYVHGGPFSEALRDSGVAQSMLINLDEAVKQADGNKNIFKTAIDKISAGNEMMEMLPRLTEYMATLKKHGVDIEAIMKDPEALKGVSMELRDMAAANAADVTVNFSRSGSVGKFINRGFVPFFNPSMQGWSKFVRNFTEMKGAKDWLGFTAKAATLGIAPLAISNFLYQDNPNYQLISARDKATNYIMAWPPGSGDDTDTFVKIPRSRFASVLGLPMVNIGNENKMGWAEFIKVAKDQVGPLDPMESNIFSPVLLAAKNETWYGAPIVPESIKNENNPSQEYDANTSYIGRALGKATERLPKELQISPKKADYIIDAETGVIGDFLLPMLTPSRQGGGNGPGKVLAPLANVPKRAFTIDSTTQNDLSSRFYDKLQAADDNRNLAKATDADAEEYKRLSAYSTENSKISKAITELQNSNKPTKQEDIRGLQKVRNQLLQDALDGKEAPGQAKTMDAVQKYVGTTYAINNFGSSADQEAMKVYGLSKYGNMTEDAMRKKIDSDTSFYNGVRAIGQLEDKLSAGGVGKSSTTLAKAIALADAGADDELFGAYAASKKGRAETANKMDRARSYLANGGSTDEFVKLEKARKDLGKLKNFDKEKELDKIDDQLAKGEITLDEWHQKEDEINYNANISYVGLATSLAQSNAPARGYKLYDIKDKNIQKGINLAAMGFTARDYREMAKAVDADGNGYPSKKEIVAYVENSDVEDKATLFDALYYYKSSRNPFGTPTNYSRDQAAAAGKAKGVDPISDERGDLDLADDEESKKSGYGYRRRRYGRRWRHYGHGHSSKKATVPTPKTIKASQFTQGTALGGTTKSASATKSSAKATPPTLKRVQAKIDLPTVKTTTKKR